MTAAARDLEPRHLFSLQGRVAVITGAAGHLGATMSLALAAAGAQTWLVGRSPSRLTILRDDIRGKGLDAQVATADVCDEASIAELVARVSRESGRLDVLVNNAHVSRGGTLSTSSVSDFEEAWRLAVIGPTRLLHQARGLLEIAAGDGSPSVINVASMYGIVSPDPRLYDLPEQVNPPFYGAAKAAMLQWTRYAAVELAPVGIRVNSLVPGPFPAAASADFETHLAGRVPLGRVGRGTELATAVLYLASPASSFTTGSMVVVDGGWTAW